MCGVTLLTDVNENRQDHILELPLPLDRSHELHEKVNRGQRAGAVFSESEPQSLVLGCQAERPHRGPFPSQPLVLSGRTHVA